MEERRNEYPYTTAGGNPYPRQGMMPRQPGYGGAPQTASRQQVRDRAAMMVQDAQVLTQNGFKPLTKEERAEAARIAEEAVFSFDGYQVVRREFFSHKFDPTLTIKGNSITFNNACISKMEQVIYVQVLVNPTTEKLVIRPCEEGARDAIRWCVAKDDKCKSREITCSLFTAKLYEMMGWEALYRYKLQGTRINYRGEQLYVFDLTSTEIFLPAMKDPENPKAKARRSAAVYPANWRDSFGIPVDQHTESVQVDLMEGFSFADMAKKTGRSSADDQVRSDTSQPAQGLDQQREDVDQMPKTDHMPKAEQMPQTVQMPIEIVDQETGEVTRV